MALTKRSGTAVCSIWLASMAMTASLALGSRHPRCSRMSAMQATSRIIRNIHEDRGSPLWRRAAAIMGSTAFLAPCMDISPFKGDIGRISVSLTMGRLPA